MGGEGWIRVGFFTINWVLKVGDIVFRIYMGLIELDIVFRVIVGFDYSWGYVF